MTRLWNENLAVIDMGNVSKTEMMRNETSISILSNVGKEARKRAILERERRFCGNKTEDITGSHVVMNKMERVAMLLDLRTSSGSHVDKATYVMAKENLKDVYTEFVLQCEKYSAIEANRKREGYGKETDTSFVKIVGTGIKPPTWNKGLDYVPGCAHDGDDEDGGEL